MIAVILAGGSGSRFWPKSRELLPKQLLQIVGSGTMIQETFQRIPPLVPENKIFVITNEAYAFETCRQLTKTKFSPKQLIAEPTGRNTAPALGLVAKILDDIYPDEIMAVFPADHVIKNITAFHDALRKAEIGAKQDRLVTLGVRPNRPYTGYGYIKQSKPLKGVSGVFEVERFIEKPNLKTAEAFLEDGSYLLNCGIFIWKISVFLDELRRFMPDTMSTIKSIEKNIQYSKGLYGFKSLGSEGQKLYKKIPSISVDYGIMEKTKNIAVVPTNMN